MSDLQVFPLAIPGGIDESQPRPQPQHLQELDNFGIFRGRVGLRAPIVQLATIQDDHSNNIDSILDITEHNGRLYILGYKTDTDEVHLSRINVDGSNQSHQAIVWTSVTTEPTGAGMVSFAGGTAASAEERLYIFDYNQGQSTRYWVEGSPGSMTTVSEDLDADGTDEDVKFALMIGYKFHLWGTGFWDADASSFRNEMIRFSQPGLVPGTDTDGTASQEWFTDDHRSVGNRGQKIRALSRAGDRLLVFQPRATHVIYGSGANTWTRQELDSATGCIGPHAVTVTDERIAYFWASDGPYRTDGSSVQYIGQPIRQSITEVETDETSVVAGYSPDDGLVYFILSPAGEDSYHKAFVFSHRQQIWATTTWLIDSGASLEIGSMVFANAEAPPAPAAAPSSLGATSVDGSKIDLAWTNGDTAVNTTTIIYRGTSTGFTADGNSQIDEVGTGVTTYRDTSLDEDTEYFYVVKHERNNQLSAASNEDSDTTWLAAPSSVELSGLTEGINISGTNNSSGSDIRIDRSTDGANWSELTTLSNPGGNFDHDDTTTTCDTTYYYRVRAEQAGATDSSWISAGNASACTATEAPAAPSDLTADSDDIEDAGSPTNVVTEKAEIDLTWTDNSDNEDGFEIQRCEGAGCTGWATIDNVAAGTESYTDDSVTDNETTDKIYRYRVRATNAVDNSAWITSGDVTLEPQLAPSSVQAQDTSHCDELSPDPQVTLTWAYGDTDDMSQITVEREVNNSGTWTTEFQTSTNPESVTQYVDDDVNFNDTFNYRIRLNFNGAENRGRITSPETGGIFLTEPSC